MKSTRRPRVFVNLYIEDVMALWNLVSMVSVVQPSRCRCHLRNLTRRFELALDRVEDDEASDEQRSFPCKCRGKAHRKTLQLNERR